MVKRITFSFPPVYSNAQGFSLFEILVAIIIFAYFSLSYVSIKFNNTNQRILANRKSILSQLCKNKFNEMIINPPHYEAALVLSPKTGDFSDIGYPDYTFKVEYKKFKLPDIRKILGKSGKEKESEKGQQGFERIILDSMKENMERMIWQIRVSVKQKSFDNEMSLSAWVNDPKQKITFQF